MPEKGGDLDDIHLYYCIHTKHYRAIRKVASDANGDGSAQHFA